jgi:hypothetical protein
MFSNMSKRKTDAVVDERIQELINQLSDTELAYVRDPQGDVPISVFGPLLQRILEKYLPDPKAGRHIPVVNTQS